MHVVPPRTANCPACRIRLYTKLLSVLWLLHVHSITLHLLAYDCTRGRKGNHWKRSDTDVVTHTHSEAETASTSTLSHWTTLCPQSSFFRDVFDTQLCDLYSGSLFYLRIKKFTRHWPVAAVSESIPLCKELQANNNRDLQPYTCANT